MNEANSATAATSTTPAVSDRSNGRSGAARPTATVAAWPAAQATAIWARPTLKGSGSPVRSPGPLAVAASRSTPVRIAPPLPAMPSRRRAKAARRPARCARTTAPAVSVMAVAAAMIQAATRHSDESSQSRSSHAPNRSTRTAAEPLQTSPASDPTSMSRPRNFFSRA